MVQNKLTLKSHLFFHGILYKCIHGHRKIIVQYRHMFSIHFLEKSPMSAIMAICRISLLASIRPFVSYSNFSLDEPVTCLRMAPGVEMQLNCPNTSAVLSRQG